MPKVIEAKASKEPEQQTSTPEPPPPDDVAETLRRLGMELAAAADDKAVREGKVKEVERFLGQLKLSDYPTLAESEVVQAFAGMFAKPDRVGEVKNKGTLAEVRREWSWEDAVRLFKPVTLIPVKSMPITWNGVGPIWLQSRKECTIPTPFYNIYRDSLTAEEQAEIHERYLLDNSDQLPDRNWLDEGGASARVRAMSQLMRPLGIRGSPIKVGKVVPEE